MLYSIPVPYRVELLYATAPRLVGSQLLGGLRAKVEGHVRLKEPLTLIQENVRHLITSGAPSGLDDALAQTWEWKGAADAARAATAAVAVEEQASLPRHDRLERMHAVVSTLVETAAPLAIHWIPAQKLIEPRAYRKSLEETEEQDLLAAPINVRFFRGEDDSFLMDTIGLAPFGLPDLECAFQGRDPGAVSRVLLNVAYYVFNEGDVLEPGHTVQGIDAGELWMCSRKRSAAAPERDVMALEAG